jgi:hypothetical protein
MELQFHENGKEITPDDMGIFAFYCFVVHRDRHRVIINRKILINSSDINLGMLGHLFFTRFSFSPPRYDSPELVLKIMAARRLHSKSPRENNIKHHIGLHRPPPGLWPSVRLSPEQFFKCL